ncbi:MAG: TlpA disulfide reductase family protein [Pyrinomonadaceae bacterium]
MKYLLSLTAVLLFGFSVFGQTEKMVGKKAAPNLKLVTLDNESINTSDLIGKVVVYNFWYVGCPPCRAEIPELNEIVEEYKGKDVVFLGLTTDSGKDLDDFLKEKPFHYRIVPGAGQMMLFNYGETQEDGSLYVPFPMHIVVNRNGFVELKVAGKKGVAAVREELKRQFADQKTAGKEKEAN